VRIRQRYPVPEAPEEQRRKHPAEGEEPGSPPVRGGVAVNRRFGGDRGGGLMRRAIDRGEISPDCDIETLSLVVPSMAAYRVLILRKPVDRAFLESLIDGVLMPAVGLARPSANRSQFGI
jgi:hypothetical protein